MSYLHRKGALASPFLCRWLYHVLLLFFNSTQDEEQEGYPASKIGTQGESFSADHQNPQINPVQAVSKRDPPHWASTYRRGSAHWMACFAYRKSHVWGC